MNIGKHGEWFVLGAAVLWGTTGTAQAIAPPGAQPLAVGAVRLAIGGLALLLFAVSRGMLHRGIRWPVLSTWVAASCMAAYQLCFFAAVRRTGVAIGTIVAIGSSPILAGILGWFLRRERPGLRWLLATLVAVAGCVLLVLKKGDIAVDPIGILLAIGAGASYATFAVASKRLLEEFSPEAVMAVVFSGGALLLSPLLFTSDLSWLIQLRGTVVALHLGLVATATAYILFARGLVSVPTATAVTLSLAEPMTAGLLGVFILGERLTAMALIGIGLVFMGLVLLSLDFEKKRHPDFRHT